MDEGQDQDCAVCMMKFNHPARLPCNHIFCFLCIKGAFLSTRACPMCRTRIPETYWDNPVLLNELTDEALECESDKYWWYYEGKDGWWSYDERSNEELESHFNDGKNECKLLVAGAVYCVDFTNLVQFRQTDPRRKRRVKRDTINHPCKGIAGIRKANNNEDRNGTNPEGDDAVILVPNSDTGNVERNVDNIEDISNILGSMTIQDSQAGDNSQSSGETT